MVHVVCTGYGCISIERNSNLIYPIHSFKNTRRTSLSQEPANMSFIYKSNTGVPRWTQFEDLELESTLNLAPAKTTTELFRPQGHRSYRGRSRSPQRWRSSSGNTEFTPDVDVFDTPASYAIHISLPGARKEDIGVNYDEVILRDGELDKFLVLMRQYTYRTNRKYRYQGLFSGAAVAMKSF